MNPTVDGDTSVSTVAIGVSPRGGILSLLKSNPPGGNPRQIPWGSYFSEVDLLWGGETVRMFPGRGGDGGWGVPIASVDISDEELTRGRRAQRMQRGPRLIVCDVR